MHPRISPATTKQALTCSSPAHTLYWDGTLKSTRWHVYNGGCPKGQTRGCPCLDLSFGRQHPNPKIIQSRAFHRFIRSSPTRLLPNPTLILEKTQTRTDWLPPLRSCHSQNWSDPTICQMPELALITTKQRSDLFHIYEKYISCFDSEILSDYVWSNPALRPLSPASSLRFPPIPIF